MNLKNNFVVIQKLIMSNSKCKIGYKQVINFSFNKEIKQITFNYDLHCKMK